MPKSEESPPVRATAHTAFEELLFKTARLNFNIPGKSEFRRLSFRVESPAAMLMGDDGNFACDFIRGACGANQYRACAFHVL